VRDRHLRRPRTRLTFPPFPSHPLDCRLRVPQPVDPGDFVRRITIAHIGPRRRIRGERLPPVRSGGARSSWTGAPPRSRRDRA
jgi:hypothetical protein